MRLVYLHSGSIPSVYANGVHVMRMCDAFTEAGHDVTLYALPGSIGVDDVYDYYGVRHRFPIRRIAASRLPLAGPWVRAVRIRRDLRAQSWPDLVYGRDPHALLAVASFGTFVYETHMLVDSLQWRWLEQRLLRARNLARVVVVSAALAGDYRRAFPELAAIDLLVAPDGADPVEELRTPPMDLPGRRQALQVGYVGHMYPGRGIDVILDLAGCLPCCDFHLVGGTAQDRAHWQSRSRHPNVYFHGHQPPAALPAYYGGFDVVLAPYQSKVACAGGIGDIGRWTSPMKLFEYMAHGKAIIASDLPVLREVMVDRVNCLLCPPADRTAWQAAVTELDDDPELRRSLGEQAQHQLLTRYTWRRRADQVLPGSVPSQGCERRPDDPR